MSEAFALQALDYIREQLLDVAALKQVALFLRGSYPLGNIPQDLCPYCEVYISNNPYNNNDVVTQRDGLRYIGGLRFIDYLASNTGYSNWVNIGKGRTYDLPGYSRIVEFVTAARNELLKCEHASLGNLTVDSEFVCEFTILQNSLGLGLDQGNRQNTWYDVGEVQFEIRAQRIKA